MIKILGEIYAVEVLPSHAGEDKKYDLTHNVVKAVAKIETNLDGRKTVNVLNGYSSMYADLSDESVLSKDHEWEAIFNLFEVMRILGFSKAQFVNALPKSMQPEFRRKALLIIQEGFRRKILLSTSTGKRDNL